MLIKKIYVEAKRSKDYQTETVGIEATVLSGDNKEEKVKELQRKANQLALDALEEI